MADNTTLDPGAGGDVIATDDVAGVKYQRVKLVDGTADSTAAIPGDATNGLDVDVTRSALPSGASTAANQTTIIGHVDGIETLLGTIDADTSNLSVVGGGTEAAAQRVTIASDSTGVLSVDDNGGSLTVDGSVSVSGAVDTELTTADLDTGAGTDTRAVVGLVIAKSGGAANISSSDPMPVSDAGGSLTVDGTVTANLAAGTNNIGDVDVLTLPALPAGTNAIGKLAANSGVDIGDVDVTSISAGTNTIGDVGVKPRTTGGLTIFRSIDLDETEEEIKATAGQVFGWYLFNAHTATLYVKFYNATAANVTVGTTTPVLTIPVPAGSAANVFSEIGIAFGTAITAAATTAVADNDTGAPGANLLQANVFYS